MSISTIHEFAVNVLKQMGSLAVDILGWLNSPLPDSIIGIIGREIMWYEFIFGGALLTILIVKLITIIIEWFSPIT